MKNVKTQTAKSKTGRVSLSMPNRIVRLKSWDEGDEILISENKGDPVLKK